MQVNTVTITPAGCTNCRLCEETCPYDAIIPSSSTRDLEKPEQTRRRFITFVILVPFISALGSLILFNLSSSLAGVDNNVRLAREIRSEKESGIIAVSQAAITYKESGETDSELFNTEAKIIQRYKKATPWIGLFLGLSLSIGLVSLSVRTERTEYKPHQGKCYSCGRCFEYCPIKIKT